MTDDTKNVLEEVGMEVDNVESKFKPYHSSHEGWGIMEEEFHELRLEIYDNKREGTLNRQRTEALQVAATAVRFVHMIDQKRRNGETR